MLKTLPAPNCYFARRPEHKQENVYCRFVNQWIDVDHQLAMTLVFMWTAGIVTEASCQGNPRKKRQSPDTRGYIKFHDKAVARQLSACLAKEKVKHWLEAGIIKGDEHTGCIRFRAREIDAFRVGCALFCLRLNER